MLRGLLDRLYAAGFVLAALSLVAIALLVLVQVLGRVIDKSLISLDQEPVGIAITSLSELGGFLFVGAAFLALAGTLRAGGHVRVTLLIHSVPASFARLLSAVALVLALRSIAPGFRRWIPGRSTRFPLGWQSSRSGYHKR